MLPPNFQPMLATIGEPFNSKEFTYEIKWDGYRCLAFIDGSTKLQSRNLKDLTPVFPDLAHLDQLCQSKGLILDGEIIALRNGKPSFPELQKRGQLRKEQQIKIAATTVPAVYVAFDILYHNYQPVYLESIDRRRTILKESVRPEENFIVAEFIEEKGVEYFQSVSGLGLEGVIAKKKGSPYLPGKRVKTWLKFKRKQIGNFLICGYTINPTSRGDLSSLIIGAYREGKLTPFGMVGTGFTITELQQIHRELKKITTELCPFTDKPEPLSNVSWTRPVIACEIEYLEITDDGSLRHPSFKGFRPDLNPEACTFEE